MKMLSLTHPHAVPIMYEFFSFVVHKMYIYLGMLVIKQLVVPIDFHGIYFPTMEVVQFFKILQNILFCVQHKKINVYRFVMK